MYLLDFTQILKKRVDLQNHQVIISHGTGNQLFQYTFAHYLALQNNCSVKIENSPIVSRLGGGKSEDFRLTRLLSRCSHSKFKRNKVISNYSFFGRALFRLGLSDKIESILTKKSLYVINLETRVTSFKFFPDAGKDSKATSFRGFWQNWRYLYPNSSIIFGEINQYLNSEVPDIQLKRTSSKVIVVHVRRGDFLIKGRDSELGLISLDSYIKVIDEIIINNPGIDIITFTDSKDCLSSEVGVNKLGEILGPDINNFWSILKIMSNADYLIAGNSTLSWWGAFLCYSKGGEVFIPKQFYKNLETEGAFEYPGFGTYKNYFI